VARAWNYHLISLVYLQKVKTENKMNKVALVSDSSAYIPQEYVEKYSLSILPLTINWQGESYYDGVDLQATEFYRQLSASKQMATTSQVTVGQFMETFKKLLDKGKDVL
jgi:DegV family protein with EDD domain